LNQQGGLWGTGGLLLFSPVRAHLLTTARRAAVVSLPLVGSCALPEASTGCFSRGGQTMPQFFKLSSLPVRLAEGRCPVCRFAANPCPLPGQSATLLRKPATGSFIAVMDDASPAPSIFFCLGKRNKTAPCRGQKGSERLWRSIILKPRS
jgi:hypothetical protein